MGCGHFGLDQPLQPTKQLRVGRYKSTPSASECGGKPCARVSVAQGCPSKAYSTSLMSVFLSAGADCIVADTFGMHPEFLVFGDYRIDAVEQALVEWRKRVGRAGLAEPFLG